MRLHRILALHAWFLILPAQASFSPELNRVTPRGTQRGTEVEFHLHGKRLDSPEELLFHQPGIEVLSLAQKNDKHLIATVRIAPDAQLGEHPFRLRTTGGVSHLRTVWIGQFPTIREKEPNNDFESPQRVDLNVTVHGVIKNEDEDVYTVSLKKGQTLSVEVEAMRLGRTMFDAYIAILDPQRFEITSCDDAPLLRTDACVSMIAPADGEYRIIVREAAYQGSDQSDYRLHIGDFPRPTAVFPTGAKPGETVEFRFIGDPSGEIRQQVTIPADAAGRFPLFARRGDRLSPSPNWIEVSPLDSSAETTSNDTVKDAEPAPPIPCALHGILETKGDRDWYRFSAKKNEDLVFKALGRGLRSPIDSTVEIRSAAGKWLAGNDDQGGPDAVLGWKCPEDGDYVVKVGDKLGQGGETFTYRLEIERRQPSLGATLPVVERNRSQLQRTICVPRGNRYATSVNLTRKNTRVEASMTAASLPEGVRLEAPKVPGAVASFPAVFIAEPDAPLSGAYHPLVIRSNDSKHPLSSPLDEAIHHIEVNNQGAYHSTRSNHIAIAVIEEAPFHLELEPPRVPIVRGGLMKLKVRAIRADGHKEPITLRYLWKSPGIGAPNTIKMDGSEADYEINANTDAAVGNWNIVITGKAETGKGPVHVSTKLHSLKVAEPYLTGTFSMLATEQGKNGSMLCQMDYASPYEGRARAEIIGLPHGVTAEPVHFSHGTKEISLPLTVAKDAATGKHSSLFLRIQVPSNGDQIIHQTAKGGTLRIDKPAPKEASKVASSDSGKPRPKPEAKPLSRLEQLRQRAK